MDFEPKLHEPLEYDINPLGKIIESIVSQVNLKLDFC